MVRAGKEGRLFGSVTRNDVVAAIEAAGIKGVDKRSIDISAPIKSTGEAEAVIALHAGVVAKVTLAVVAEK